jgi:hypothetical protein
MAVTVHPHHRVPLHGLAGIASIGAALTATAVIGFVGANALAEDGDRSPTPAVEARSSAGVTSVLDWPTAGIGAPSSFAGSPEQRAFLDQFAADLGLDPVAAVLAPPLDPDAARGLTDLIPRRG